MIWTEHILLDTLDMMRARRGDTTSIEVKRAAGGVPQMPETLCAFANMPDGGTIILGVDEAQGSFTITGIDDIASMESALSDMARMAVSPCPHLEFQTLSIGGKTVLIAQVSPLRIADKPAFTGGRAYLRQSDGDYAMHPHELRMIEVSKLHADEQVNYDLKPMTGRSRVDLNPELLSSYLTSVRTKDRRLSDRSDEQILQMTNVLTSSGEPTLAGLYALGDYPQGQYPALRVTAAVQLPGGETGARNRNLEDFTGPVPILLEDVMSWVERNIGFIHSYRPDGHMETLPELPLNAIRELVANALVHRDLGPNTLGVGKQIQIRLTPRNLFIQSPGGLRGVSLANLESIEHAQAAVNQRLYQISKRLKTPDGFSVIEGEGGGIASVFEAMNQRGLARPQLIDTGVQFTALLWRASETRSPSPTSHWSQDHSPQKSSLRTLPGSSSPTRNEALVIASLAANPESSTLHSLIEDTGLTAGQVRYALRLPIEEGVVVMDGKQGLKSTRYRLLVEE